MTTPKLIIDGKVVTFASPSTRRRDERNQKLCDDFRRIRADNPKAPITWICQALAEKYGVNSQHAYIIVRRNGLR